MELRTQMKRKPIKSTFYMCTGTKIIQLQALMKESKKNKTVEETNKAKGMETFVYIELVHRVLTARGLI